MDLEKEIEQIKLRNKKVEKGKLTQTEYMEWLDKQ